MPCYTIRTTTVAVGTLDEKILKEAMSHLGISSSKYSYSGEQITVRGDLAEEELINKIKVEYSAEVVRQTAQVNGWEFTETKNEEGLYDFVVNRN